MLLVLFFPFMSFFILFFCGRFLNRIFLIYSALSLMLFSLCSVIYFFYEININLSSIYVYCGFWIKFDDVYISWNFLFDSLTMSLLLVVILISCLVHIFSVDYMHLDPFFLKFISYLSLFTFFMLILVTAGNFFQLFLGWEGVGLASYLLINFWFTRKQANKSALKAVIVNRIGDFCLYFAILLIFYNFKTLDFYVIFSNIYMFSHTCLVFFGFKIFLLDLISFFLFFAAMGKSAQVGLHTWLPDAMEGPTPVSALIHAATMVTAGIFLLIRSSIIFEYSNNILLFITFIGALTIIFSSTAGFFQFDLKKVIAYSTCSQLGYMVFACGNSQYVLALYHLFNHAFFKALLFLGAGSVIHAMMDEQDVRKMGGLWKLLPISYVSFLIGSLSLMGLPFLTGFYSKDVILEVASFNLNISSVFSWYLALIAVTGTSYYSMRLIYLVFFNDVNIIVNVKNIKESPYFTLFVLSILCILSIQIGYFFKEFFNGPFSDLWLNIYISPKNYIFFEEEYLSIYFRILPFIFTFLGFCLVLIFYKFFHFFNFKVIKVLRFFGGKWFFDAIYNNFLVLTILKFAYNITFKLLDKGFIEKLGSITMSRIFKEKALNFSLFQSGFLYHYLLICVLSICFMFFFINFALLGDLIFFFLALFLLFGMFGI